jgi:hypothetical protein
MDAPSNWLFKLRFPRPGTGIPNALRGVLKAKALTTPGAVFPFVGFQGAGVTMTVVAGVPTTHLRGPLRVDVDGFSTDAITNVQLWAGAKLVYSGPPRRAMEGTELLLDAGFLTDGNIRVVASTSGATGDETYTDITAHARVAGVIAPPRTFATPASGHLLPGQTVALSAQSDAHPVRISYRVSGGAWQRYTAPFLLPDGNQTLEFFGVDYLGNVEGGVDHDP